MAIAVATTAATTVAVASNGNIVATTAQCAGTKYALQFTIGMFQNMSGTVRRNQQLTSHSEFAIYVSQHVQRNAQECNILHSDLNKHRN